MNPKLRHRINQFVFFFYAVFVPIALLVDWAPPQPKKSYDQVFISPEEKEFLLQEHTVVTQEIQARIEHEHLLFVLKFSVVGAVLGLIFRLNQIKENEGYLAGIPTPGMAIVCWGAVAVSAIIDVRVFFNVNMIRQAGMWVHELEASLTSGSVRGWETALAESDLWKSDAAPFIVLDRQLLTWVLYIMTLYVFVPRGMSDQPGRHRELLQIAARALPICVVLFGIVGLNFYSGSDDCLRLHSLLTVAFAAFGGLWLHRWNRSLGSGVPIPGTPDSSSSTPGS